MKSGKPLVKFFSFLLLFFSNGGGYGYIYTYYFQQFGLISPIYFITCRYQIMQWVLSTGRHLSKYFFWLIFVVDFASWFAFHIFSFQILVDLLHVYGGMRLCQLLLHELSLTIRSSPCLNCYSLKGYARGFLMVNMSLYYRQFYIQYRTGYSQYVRMPDFRVFLIVTSFVVQ